MGYNTESLQTSRPIPTTTRPPASLPPLPSCLLALPLPARVLLPPPYWPAQFRPPTALDLDGTRGCLGLGSLSTNTASHAT